MAGKGDKWRKNFNYSRYWKNWDKIKKPLEESLLAPTIKSDAKNGKTAEQQSNLVG